MTDIHVKNGRIYQRTHNRDSWGVTICDLPAGVSREEISKMAKMLIGTKRQRREQLKALLRSDNHANPIAD